MRAQSRCGVTGFILRVSRCAEGLQRLSIAYRCSYAVRNPSSHTCVNILLRPCGRSCTALPALPFSSDVQESMHNNSLGAATAAAEAAAAARRTSLEAALAEQHAAQLASPSRVAASVDKRGHASSSLMLSLRYRTAFTSFTVDVCSTPLPRGHTATC